MMRRPGSLVSCSVHSLIHSPQLQFLPARDSNPQPLDYESNSLTIRPRLPAMASPLEKLGGGGYSSVANIFPNLSLRSFRWTIKMILNRTAALLTWCSRTTSPDTTEEAGGDVETGACQAWIQPSYISSPMMQAQQICSVDKMQLNSLPDVNER